MMQADEIIKNKEWPQLTSAEKAFIQELAANEDEFRLLKEVISISSEVDDDVPMINPQIQSSIKAKLFPAKKKTNYWYAAAIIIGILFCTVLFLQWPAKDPVNVTVSTKTPPDPVNDPTPIPDRYLDTMSVLKKDMVSNKTSPVIKKQNTNNGPVNSPVINIPDYRSLNSSVSDDLALLDLVTELN